MRASEDTRHEGAPAFEPKVSRFVPPHRRYTPELIASGRVRYEQTTESVAAIAADFDVLPGSFRRMARKFNWVRHGTAPRRLPEATRLRAETDALECLLIPVPEPEPLQKSLATPEPETPLSAIDRLERAVMAELSSVERMRKYLGRFPMQARDATRTARTLSTLTDTLGKLQRMRAVTGAEGGAEREAPAQDDGPEDIHAFRLELARRIAALSADHQEAQAAENDALQRALWPD
jgi:hypothetical protein